MLYRDKHRGTLWRKVGRLRKCCGIYVIKLMSVEGDIPILREEKRLENEFEKVPENDREKKHVTK